ncbi:hypothetical protein ACO1PF_04045 [Alkalibacterium sp. f15]|uniref:hypothetical protein n=1 Tax=Alkalibacterium sp. f15 TaxID=3414029 RepID=UPI003BF83DE8
MSSFLLFTTIYYLYDFHCRFVRESIEIESNVLHRARSWTADTQLSIIYSSGNPIDGEGHAIAYSVTFIQAK